MAYNLIIKKSKGSIYSSHNALNPKVQLLSLWKHHNYNIVLKVWFGDKYHGHHLEPIVDAQVSFQI